MAEQGGLCAGCWDTLEVPGEPACRSCMRPMGQGKATIGGECAFCQIDPPRHCGIHAATLYNDPSRDLILKFKHGGKIALSRLMGRLMASRLPSLENGEQVLLIPVPLHRWRLWARGYNQSGLLARELARHGKGELLVDGLERCKRTPSLGGLGQQERRRVLNGAIRVRPARAERIAGADVILVDDVLTSGATSNACVDALIQAGRNRFGSPVLRGCSTEVLISRGKAQNITPEAIKTPGAT